MIRRQFLFLTLALTGLSLIPLAAQAATDDRKDDRKKGGGSGYTQFRTISVFTDASKRRHGTLSVDMGLYTDDPKLTELIILHQPRLQDAYLTRLQAYAGGLNARSLVDSEFISTQLQQATDTVLARKGAKVLLGTILLN